MIINLSTGAVNAMINSPGLAAALEASNNMELRVYSGAMPASADAAIGAATLLCVFKNGAAGITWSDAVAGGLSKPAGEVWAGAAVATGIASFGRFVLGTDAGAESLTAVRIQGDVANIGAFINLDNPSFVSGVVQSVNSAQLLMPRQ